MTGGELLDAALGAGALLSTAPPEPVIPTHRQVYLICELLTGGELLDAVLERGSYSEADARLCFVQLLRGLDYLHER